MLEVTGFQAGYSSNPRIMGGDSFTIPPATVVGLLGGNGAGKTTFIKGLTGLLKFWDADSVRFDGEEISTTSRDFKRQRFVVFAEDSSFSQWTFKDLLKYLTSVYNVAPETHEIDTMIEGFNFRKHVDTRLADLSSGNNKKARLICAFALHRPLLILDEPVDFLDFTGTEFLYGRIINYAKQGHSVLMSSHIAESFSRCCSTLYVLEHGELGASQPVPRDPKDVVRLLSEKPDAS